MEMSETEIQALQRMAAGGGPGAYSAKSILRAYGERTARRIRVDAAIAEITGTGPPRSGPDPIKGTKGKVSVDEVHAAAGAVTGPKYRDPSERKPQFHEWGGN
jgi:hypothetical protein